MELSDRHTSGSSRWGRDAFCLNWMTVTGSKGLTGTSVQDVRRVHKELKYMIEYGDARIDGRISSGNRYKTGVGTGR